MNKEDSEIELILMNSNGKVIDQLIFKDSVSVIEKINGIEPFRLILKDAKTEVTLIDSLFNFWKK